MARKNFLLKRKFSRIKPKFFKYTFYLKLKGKVYPEGMRDRVVLISDKNEPLCSDNLLFINRLSEEKLDKDDSVITLSVSALVPPGDLVKEGFTEKFPSACKEKIAKIMPFMDEYFVSIDAPRVKSYGDLETDLRSNFVYDSEYPAYFGVTALPYSTFLKNLFFVDQSVYPGLGFDGEVQSGLKVAREISSSFKVKRP